MLPNRFLTLNCHFSYIYSWTWIVGFDILSLQEAKNAFKALLESANVEADWSWDQVN